jgi:hypothetical protein
VPEVPSEPQRNIVSVNMLTGVRRGAPHFRRMTIDAFPIHRQATHEAVSAVDGASEAVVLEPIAMTFLTVLALSAQACDAACLSSRIGHPEMLCSYNVCCSYTVRSAAIMSALQL